MKQPLSSDIQRLEKKMDLINYKLDRLLETHGVEFKRPQQEIDKEEERERKAWERKQTKLLQEENLRMRLIRMAEDKSLQRREGYDLQKKFNLAALPSANRIREYKRTNSAAAFNGLRRNSG